MFKKKTPLEKLLTKVNTLVKDSRFIHTSNKVKFNNKSLFEYDAKKIHYGYLRAFVNQADPLIEENFEVSIPLTHENLDLLNSTLANPPMVAKTVIDLLRKTLNVDFQHLIIGATNNTIKGKTVSITTSLYQTIKK